MASLKSFLFPLARILRTTPDTLYGRQRQLVSLGLLAAKKGKGPGSGVQLSADAVGVMLIACLCANTVTETDERVVHICEAKSLSGESFREGVATAISQDFDASVIIIDVRVERCWKASISYAAAERGIRLISYEVAHEAIGAFEINPPIAAIYSLNNTALREIRAELSKAMAAGDEE